MQDITPTYTNDFNILKKKYYYLKQQHLECLQKLDDLNCKKTLLLQLESNLSEKHKRLNEKEEFLNLKEHELSEKYEELRRIQNIKNFEQAMIDTQSPKLLITDTEEVINPEDLFEPFETDKKSSYLDFTYLSGGDKYVSFSPDTKFPSKKKDSGFNLKNKMESLPAESLISYGKEIGVPLKKNAKKLTKGWVVDYVLNHPKFQKKMTSILKSSN